MNYEALFLFLILLLGLVLSSFLGDKRYTEGFSDKPSETLKLNDTNIDKNIQISSGASTASPTQYDNYNHYTGSSSELSPGTSFYDMNGRSATVISNSDGSQSLQIILPNSSKPVTFNQSQNPISSNKESYTNYNINTQTYYGPDGAIATIVKTNNGQEAIKVATSSGTYYYNSSGEKMTTDTSTQYYGSTGQPNQPTGYSTAYQAPSTDYDYSNRQYYGPYSNDGMAGPITEPEGKSAYYPEIPIDNISSSYGMPSNSSYGMPSNDYNSSLPKGIPKTQIPYGQEDLYILKSQIVPPVCPACPPSTTYPRQEPCQPCPPCARCPEPAFECKKVPNYNAINNEYLPAPVLNDFSQFGM
jgi:hypothetical protein